MNLYAWQRGATKDARSLVLSIIGSQTPAPTLQQIYKLAIQRESSQSRSSQSGVQQPAPSEPNRPPYPDHAIRSMSYLRHVVIPSLIQTKDIEKVHMMHELTPEEREQRMQTMTRSSRKQASSLSDTVDVWRWQIRAHKPTPPKPKLENTFGKDVGVGVDWSHLNRRRQRSRVLSVIRDVRWLRRLEHAKAEGTKAKPRPIKLKVEGAKVIIS